MTTRDDAIAALDIALEAARVEGAQSRDAEVQALIAHDAILTTRVGELEAEIDVLQAYKDSHPETPPDEPPPPPPPAGPVIGMNYSSKLTIATFNKPYEPKAKVARVFVDSARTNINQEPEYVRARANGINTIILSWKDTAVPAWLTTVPGDVKWYGVAHHEPEEMTAADWKAIQVKHMSAVRAAGDIPSFIFTNYFFNPKNTTTRMADWVCPTGTHDAGGVDFYPDKAPKLTQVQCVANWKAAMKTFGVARWIMGEYGVISTAPDAVADIKEIKALISGWVEAACYWSSQADGKPNYRLSDATAAAWLT